MSTLTTAVPRTRIDAQHVLANPGLYADRPTLAAYARLISASAAGRTIPQRHRPPAHVKPAPCLIVIDGGRA